MGWGVACLESLAISRFISWMFLRISPSSGVGFSSSLWDENIHTCHVYTPTGVCRGWGLKVFLRGVFARFFHVYCVVFRLFFGVFRLECAGIE